MDLTRLKYHSRIASGLKDVTKLGDSLVFKKLFRRSGKQGLLGLFEYTDDHKKKHTIVFKLSLYTNYLAHHEHKIMHHLLRLSGYCHNFCHSYGITTMDVSAQYKQSVNPFSQKKDCIQADVFFMEYLDACKKFFFYIKNKQVPNELIFSQMKQVLCATYIAQQDCRLTHYDLHSNNVLLKECDPNTLFLYVLDEENQYLIPSYGFYPIIIDFGFSYSGACESTPLYGALAHTDVGFLSSEYDPLADPRLFLVSISAEMGIYRKSDPVSKDFRKFVKDLFDGLRIDWESGWDDDGLIPASDYVSYMLEDDMRQSSFFDAYGHYCVDIVQALIDLPLKKRSYEDISDNFNVFYKEFEVLEELFSSNFYLLYMFKRIVDFAMKYKKEYLSEKTRSSAVRGFKYDLFAEISKYIKFSNPPIHYERMLCSLIMLSRNVEGILYDAMQEKLKIREKQKRKLAISSILDIFPRLDYQFSDSYTLSKENTIVVVDRLKQSTYTIHPSQETIDELNEMDEIFRGFFLYQSI
jgi:hypothetical protein